MVAVSLKKKINKKKKNKGGEKKKKKNIKKTGITEYRRSIRVSQ